MTNYQSSNFNSAYYTTTRKGRSTAGDMGWEMFPEKLEKTDLEEDEDMVENMWRTTLRDRSPDTNRLFESEVPRRNNFSRQRLNLREFGSFSGVQPWKSEEFDTQFHDKDPRGSSLEHPWHEFNRNNRIRFAQKDFKSDADYSVQEKSVTPSQMLKNIKSTIYWLKGKYKIFDTAYTNHNTKKTGRYDKVSNVYKNYMEKETNNVDSRVDSIEKINDPKLTMIMSDLVHNSSKFFKTKRTTDHKVTVAAYGKLFSQKGLMDHESQMRMIQDDTPWSKLETAPGMVNRNLIKMMSSSVAGVSADQANRAARTAGESVANADKYNKSSYASRETDTRKNAVIKDILSLMGITENEVKFLCSKSQTNRKQKSKTLAEIFKMVEVVHKLPAHARFEIRDALLFAGLKPADASSKRIAQNNTLTTNPKLLKLMENSVRKQKTPEDFRNNSIADPENKLNNKLDIPVFVPKSRDKTDKVTEMMFATDSSNNKKDSRKTKNYKGLIEKSREENRRNAILTQDFSIADIAKYGKSITQSEDFIAAKRNSNIDNDFHNFGILDRKIKEMGTKKTGKYTAFEDSRSVNSLDSESVITPNKNYSDPRRIKGY